MLAAHYRTVLDAVPAPLAVDRSRSAYGVRTVEGLDVRETWLPRPSGLPAQTVLAAPHGLGDHARLRSGRLPRAAGDTTAGTRAVEAAVTAETAKTLRIEVGSVLHVPAGRAPLAVRVTGIVEPREPDGPYWATAPVLRTPP